MRFELARNRRNEFDDKSEMDTKVDATKRKALQDLEDQILVETNPDTLEKCTRSMRRWRQMSTRSEGAEDRWR